MSEKQKFYFVKAMPLNNYLVDFEVIKADVKKLDRWVMTIDELEGLRKELTAKVDKKAEAWEKAWRKKHNSGTPNPRAHPKLFIREPRKGEEVYLCGDGYNFETLLACVPIERPIFSDQPDTFHFGEKEEEGKPNPVKTKRTDSAREVGTKAEGENADRK